MTTAPNTVAFTSPLVAEPAERLNPLVAFGLVTLASVGAWGYVISLFV